MKNKCINLLVLLLTNAGDTCLTRGANLSYAIHTLSQWKCYTKESNLPCSKVVNNAGASIDPKFSEWHGSAKFRNAKILNINSDPEAVKQAIMEYGAVLVTYHDDISYFSVKSGDTYYYNPNDEATNHDVVLVGSNDIKVSWGKSTGATGYTVYYKQSTASAYKFYKNTTSRSMKFPNLKSNKKYNFKIVPYYKYDGTKYNSLQSKVVSCFTK